MTYYEKRKYVSDFVEKADRYGLLDVTILDDNTTQLLLIDDLGDIKLVIFVNVFPDEEDPCSDIEGNQDMYIRAFRSRNIPIFAGARNIDNYKDLLYYLIINNCDY